MHYLIAIQTIWQREILRYARDRIRIISSFFQPIMFLVIFGTGLRRTLAQGDFGVDFVKFMYPGIIAMSVMGVAFFSTISTVWDREFGFLKEILVAPVPRSAVALGKSFGAATIASCQAILLLIMAPIIGISLHPLVVIELFAFMLLLAFAISGLGLFVASLMKSTESFGLVMQVLFFPMFFMSGAFFPLTNVPTWMNYLSKINPLTYGVDAFRQILIGSEIPKAVADRIILFPLYADGVFMIVFSLFLVSLAVRAFNRYA